MGTKCPRHKIQVYGRVAIMSTTVVHELEMLSILENITKLMKLDLDKHPPDMI